MANFESFKAGPKTRHGLAGRRANAFTRASINLRSAFRAALAFTPFIPPTPIPPAPPTILGPKVVAPFPFWQPSLDTTYGVDVLCLTDLDPYLSLTTALQQDLFHLVTEGPGSLFWAPSVSFSIINLLSQGLTQAAQSQVQAAMQAVILSDERVATAQVIVTFDGRETLSAKISVVPQVGQAFQLVLGINKVSITLISVGFANL